MTRYLAAPFLVLVLVGMAFADPPKFEPPSEMKPIGEYVIYSPPADCVSARYIGLDGVDGFPLELIGGSKTAFFLPIRGLPEGTYKFAGVASSKTGEQVEKRFVVVIGKGGVVKPPDKDPPDPDPIPAKGLYFMIVRADGPSPPEFTRLMADPAWAELQKAGHQFKDFTLSTATTIGAKIPPGTTLPTVITLRVAADGKSSTVVRDVFPLPTTSEGIRKLPEGVK